MSILSRIPGFGGDRVGRFESGIGYIHKRTIEIGATILSVDNVGSMGLFDGTRSHGPAVLASSSGSWA